MTGKSAISLLDVREDTGISGLLYPGKIGVLSEAALQRSDGGPAITGERAETDS